MEFRLFGAVECWVAGERIYVGAAKERCLLAALLLAGGSSVSADSLIMNLWGDSPPGDAEASLRSSISHLRKYFRDAGDEVEIRSVQRTYALIVDPDAVDVHRFRNLRAQARSIAESDDYELAVSLLREADSISACEPLTGLSGDWVERMRVSLGRERHGVAVEQADALLRLGRNSDVIEYLQRLLIGDPLDEAFGERLLLALYRHGQQAEAIRLYHQIARRLDDSLGTDPGPRLRELYRRIVAQDPALDLANYRPLRVAGPAMLPPEIDDFTGRQDEIAGLVKSVSSGAHTIVIEGLGGIGKTSLAIRVAHELAARYPDGQMFLPLQTHDPRDPDLMSPEAVLLALLEKIEVPAKRIPARLDARITLWRQELLGRRIIVVLDDVADVRQVQPALTANRHCLFLLTSRQALSELGDAHRLSLKPLSSDDATAMFATISGVAYDKHQSAVTELVETCSGLPLAIRLTAAQMREGQSVGATAVALQDELRSAQDEDEISAASAQLDAVFDSSYRVLDPTQAQAFRRLGLRPGADLGLDAARELVGLSPSAFDKAIEVLADHYLVERTEDGRLRCHDLLRRYAYRRARRDESLSDGRRAVHRLLDYYVQMTGGADRLLYPHRLRRTSEVPRQARANHHLAAPDEGQRWMETEWQAVLAAIRYAADYEWPYHAIALADAIAEFINTSGRWEEAEDAYRRALRVARELQISDAAAHLSLVLATALWRTGRYQEAEENATTARDIFHDAANRQGEAAAHNRIGLVLWSSGRFAEAQAHFDEGRDAYAEVNDQRGVSGCLMRAGMALWHTGNYVLALQKFHEALAGYRRLGDIRGQAITLNNIADAELHLGLHRDAAEHYQETYELLGSNSSKPTDAILLTNFGNLRRYKGRYREALDLYRRALAKFRETGERYAESGVLNCIGDTYILMERYSEALIHYQEALSIADAIDHPYEKARSLLGVGEGSSGKGQYKTALEQYNACIAMARELGDPYLEARSVSGIAKIELVTKGVDRARIYWRQALAMYERLGVPEEKAIRVRLHRLPEAGT